MSDELRVCARCKQQTRRKGASYCPPCNVAYVREWKDKNKERIANTVKRKRVY